MRLWKVTLEFGFLDLLFNISDLIMTKEEFKACVYEAFHTNEHWEQFLECVGELYLQATPHWISVEDELPRINPNDSEWEYSDDVIVALKDGSIAVGRYERDNSIGEHYWVLYGVDKDLIVTHWMALPQPPEHIAGISNKTACPDCFVAQYPPCGKGIPCCKCHEEGCNSRQPCPKKGGEQ